MNNMNGVQNHKTNSKPFAEQIMPRYWLQRPNYSFRKQIWSRFLKIERHPKLQSWNIHWTQMIYVAEEIIWIAAVAGITYAIEKCAPTFIFNQRAIQLRPSPNGIFLPPDALLHPYLKQPKWTKTIYNATIITVVPTLIFTGFQLKLRSFCDFHSSIAGTFKAIFMA